MSTSQSTEVTDQVVGKSEAINPKHIIFAAHELGSGFWNARTVLAQAEMDELCESIQTKGLLEDIVVRKIAGNQYQVVVGERRLRCILKLLKSNANCYDLGSGKTKKASQVYSPFTVKVLYHCSDKEASSLSVTENLKRKDLSELEMMQYCQNLEKAKAADGVTPLYSRKDIQDIIGKSASWISQTNSLFNLHPRVRKMLEDGTIGRTVALSFLKADSSKIDEVIDTALKISDAHVNENKNLSDIDAEQAEVDALGAELSVLAVSAAGVSSSEVRGVKAVKQGIDKRLKEALAKSRTAKGRGSRLTAEAINEATDQVAARKGKSSGVTDRGIRVELKKMNLKLASAENGMLEYNDEIVSVRDIQLVMLGLKMAIGEVSERDVLSALLTFNKE